MFAKNKSFKSKQAGVFQKLLKLLTTLGLGQPRFISTFLLLLLSGYKDFSIF